MFFEDVPVVSEIGTTPAQIFDRYGLDHGRLNAIVNLPESEHLRQQVGTPIQLHTPLYPAADSIRLPIHVGIQIIKGANPVVDMQKGLRPLPMGGAVAGTHVKPFTHGVEVLLKHTFRPCKRIRWVQAVQKRNNPDPKQPKAFVDGGGNGLDLPFDDTPPSAQMLDDPGAVQSDDVPCGPQSPGKSQGLEWRGAVSLVVWTIERITRIKSLTYGVVTEPGTSPRSVRPDPPMRAGAGGEVQEQIRTLEKGINALGQSTGGKLVHNPPPADRSINAGISRGQF